MNCEMRFNIEILLEANHARLLFVQWQEVSGPIAII